MNRDEIIRTIRELANSQGFYGRLLHSIITLSMEAPDTYEELMTKLEEENFKDPVDMILFFEN